MIHQIEEDSHVGQLLDVHSHQNVHRGLIYGKNVQIALEKMNHYLIAYAFLAYSEDQ